MAITKNILDCVTFNCNGYKGSSLYVEKLIQMHDIVFLCEHWMQPKDLVMFEQNLDYDKYWTCMKSSVNPDECLKGRPFGGIGYVCKKIVNCHFKTVPCENDRICIIQLAQEDSVKVTGESYWCLYALLE